MGSESVKGKAKLQMLFDDGTFVETESFVKRNGECPVAVSGGYGAVGNQLVFGFSQDSDIQSGAFDKAQAKKIAALYNLAMKNRAPIVGVFDSNGAFVKDGASAMSAYGLVLQNVSRASGIIPQIAVIAGTCAGLAATIASMFDIVITIEEKSQLFVNAPFLTGKEVGKANYVAANGLSSITVKSEEEAFQMVKKLINVLPANNYGRVEADVMDDANRVVSLENKTGKALLQEICDGKNYVEIGDAYAKEIITAFTTFGGVSAGVLCSNPTEKNGVLTADAAKKAAKFLSFCDAFEIPVVTLVDSEGVENGKDAEDASLASQLGKLAMTYADADVAKISIITGKAYGAAFTLLGSKALGADIVYAVENSAISAMKPEAAVAFLWNDKITQDKTREDLEKEWKETMATPEAAAADGSIDDVISASELRMRICSALYMLSDKANDDGKKHCVLPL